MKIEIKNTTLKDVWDIQKAKKILEIGGISGDVKGLNKEVREKFEKEITFYLWKNMLKQFPKLKEFCIGKTGGFNEIKEKQFNTPIINIYGDFYIQLIVLNNKNNWVWESVNLEPFRFEFNEEGYFKDLIVEAINKAIISENATKETFKNLINALNETKTKESFITIQTKGKDLGKVDLRKVETSLI